MAKIGVLGGSFDPVHNGHLVVAKEVLDRLGLDKVFFTPASQQWQKNASTSPADRAQMVKLAIADSPNFELCTIDIDRGGPTYTVDTLSDLHKQNPSDDFYFVLGADAFASIETWRNFEHIPELARLVVVSRPGHAIEVPDSLRGKIDVVEIPALDISSSQCRALAETGIDLTGLVPNSVNAYIRECHTYQKAPMSVSPLTRREARELERRREHLALNGLTADDDALPVTGPIEVVAGTQSNSIVVSNLPDVANMTLVLPDSGALLKTGAIELPVIKPDTGQIAIVDAAASADANREFEQLDNAVSGIEPVAARVHQRTRRRSSVFPTRLRQGWGVVHLVLISGFILLAIFCALLGAIMLGSIKVL